MTSPEDALREAREAAAASHRVPEEANLLAPSPAPEEDVPSAQLIDWAVIDPDLEEVRSTRRFGAPITALKRLLLRLLMQYHLELTAQQTRFNLALLMRVRQLEERVDELERGRDGGKPQ